MLDNLVRLVEEYEDVLKRKDGSSVDYSNMRDFELQLIIMDNFPYKIKEMQEMVSILDKRKLGLYSKYNILEMLLRRKAMDNITRVDKRKDVWISIDNYFGQYHSKSIFLLYVAKYGLLEAESDFKKLQISYNNKIFPNLQKLKRLIEKTKDRAKKCFLMDVYENHMQRTSVLTSFVIPDFLKEIENIKEKHKSKARQ